VEEVGGKWEEGEFYLKLGLLGEVAAVSLEKVGCRERERGVRKKGQETDSEKSF